MAKSRRKKPVKKKLKSLKKKIRSARKAIRKKVKKAARKIVRARARQAKKKAKTVSKKIIRSAPAPKKVEAPTPPASTVELHEGEPAPNFTVATDEGRTVSLSDFRGKKVVLYFYPKDDTPGCTVEACAFRDGFGALQSKGAEVLGVSVDDVASHQKFKEKFHLNFPLLADTDKKIVNDYGVWKEKSMYGRNYMGIERTTFLIDESGAIKKIFPKVDVKMHYDEVVQALG
jgi:peroxiredoxin Q/BCP